MRMHRATAANAETGSRSLGAFLRDDGGVVTIEFIAWIPAFVWMLSLICDFSFIFMTNASMWDAARDAARRVALHKLTAHQAETYLREDIFSPARNMDVSVTSDTEQVVVYVRTNMRDASPLGFFLPLLPSDLIARVIMLREPE